MRDVHDDTGRERGRSRRHQERSPRPSKDLDDVDNFGLRCFGNCRELGDGTGTPDAARIGHEIGQRPEDPFRDLSGAIGSSLEIRLFGVSRQCVTQTPHRLIVGEVDRPSGLRSPRPEIPRSHERVLEYWQPILVVADVIQESLHEPRGDLPAGHGDGTRDGRPQLIARQARDEILTRIERFRQTRILHAVTDEIGSHGQDHVNGNIGLAAGVEEQLDEGDGLVAGPRVLAAPLEPEQLLELVDDHEDVIPGWDPGQLHCVDKPSRSAAQRRIDEHTSELPFGRPDHVRRRECGGEVTDRVFSGSEDRHAPARSRLRHRAAVKRRDQAASNQRGLAAARRADDRQESIRSKPPQQLVDLVLATEKETVLVGFEGTKTGERTATLAFTVATKGASGSGVQPSNCGMTVA